MKTVWCVAQETEEVAGVDWFGSEKDARAFFSREADTWHGLTFTLFTVKIQSLETTDKEITRRVNRATCDLDYKPLLQRIGTDGYNPSKH